uniref:NADH-ubiquinone oxidoreductase chain 5 n=1 Tax=Sporolithon durum TaxID=48970 RepID=V9P535_9FLOR|nr:NADH dehydrogenase subunit 5 [Sporolithon durum]AGU16691.1 NADH dehydrogenase subunit 5 [Sporolithon durum]
MYLLILVLPLLGSIISGLGGRWLGRYGTNLITIFCVGLSMILSIGAFYEVGLTGSFCYLFVGSWIKSGILSISWSLLFDSLTCTMLVVITVISTLVHLYSIKYMEYDPHCPRFMSYLEIFTFFMLVLVTADNLIQMFLGWEGVGLASYLLINFWYTRLDANQSAIKALVVNRIGDFSLMIGIFLTFYVFQSVDYLLIFTLASFFSNHYLSFLGFDIHSLSLISIFFFFGAVGKSSQLGLHTWLPDAMEGPTPVSALIHAATMVTAGVFLMARFSPILEFSPMVLFLMIIFGALTAFFASMVGIFQNDLKRVIAYSTCSQLGYMIFCCGMSCYNVSLFHLFNHAFFKALLFLSAGSVIHAVSDEQDMRRMGSLIKFLPATYSFMLIGSMTLSGFPFLTGFYSKDFILELSQVYSYSNLEMTYISFACLLGSLSVFLTAFYSFRLIYLTFINTSNKNNINKNHLHESSFLMLLPLIILSIGSIFIGYIMKDLFIGFGTNFWINSIFILPSHTYFLEAEWLELVYKWFPFIASLIGIILSSFINIRNINIYNWFYNQKLFFFLSFLSSKKWYWDVLYNRFLILPLLKFGYSITFKILDRGFIELAGPYGISQLTLRLSKIIRNLQTGQVTHYIFFIILGLATFLSIINSTYLHIFDFRLLLIFCFLIFLV